MRSRWTSALAGLALALALDSSAAAAEEKPAPPAPPQAPAPPVLAPPAARPAASPRRLRLGLYGRPSAPQQTVEMMLRFESSIEVLGERPRDYNATMAQLWRQWNLSTGSIYGKGINFQNQGCPTCVNVLPLIERVIDKIKKK